MLTEVGLVSAPRLYAAWTDFVPSGTPVIRRTDMDFRDGGLESKRYEVPDGTPVVRVEFFEDGRHTEVPEGYVAVDVASIEIDSID